MKGYAHGSSIFQKPKSSMYYPNENSLRSSYPSMCSPKRVMHSPTQKMIPTLGRPIQISPKLGHPIQNVKRVSQDPSNYHSTPGIWEEHRKSFHRSGRKMH
ncbi:hypothetical protein V6N13_059704 [Hibiscus sabdariffa]